MTGELVCWKCGNSVESLPQPFARAAECEACGADLHVCRMCEFHDPTVSRGCREPVAEDVRDKARANFCGYFRAMPGAHRPGSQADSAASRAALDALFGGPGNGAPTEGAPGDAETARSELDALFGLDPEKKS